MVAGVEVALRTFTLLSSEVEGQAKVKDGQKVGAGAVLLELEGPVRALLGGERVALNILQHLSGVATLTRRFVDAVEGTGVKILDTRKTLPGLRALEKWAVRAGGGANHRSSLSDGILVKENHLTACGGVSEAVKALRARAPHTLRLEIEASTLEEVEEAVAEGVEAILLDNMPVEMIREAVRLYMTRENGAPPALADTAAINSTLYLSVIQQQGNTYSCQVANIYTCTVSNSDGWDIEFKLDTDNGDIYCSNGSCPTIKP